MTNMNGVEGISLSSLSNQETPHLAVATNITKSADMQVLSQGALQKRCSPLARINPLQSDSDSDIMLSAVSNCGGAK